MKKVYYILVLSIMAWGIAYAQEKPIDDQAIVIPVSVSAIPLANDQDSLDHRLRAIEREWARIKYHEANPSRQAVQMAQLVKVTAKLGEHYPKLAEPKIWQAIALSSQAAIQGGLKAIWLMRDARDLLEEAEEINPNAQDGAIYTLLGALYYHVPAWPIAFGDDDKALAYLEHARALNPNGIDPNYYYGDFMIEQGKYQQAIEVLEHALNAPVRPGYEDADAGRRHEIEQAIAKAKSKLKG